MRYAALSTALAAVACSSDQDFKEFSYRDIAVVAGDFDHIGETLIRLDVGFTEYEGFIAQSVYDPELNTDSNVLKSDALFFQQSDSGRSIMLDYDAIFVNSGVRGLGEFTYNGVEDDSTVVSDPVAVENIRSFVANGNTLIASDWAGDMIEAAWPEAIEFVNESECDSPPCWDAPQVGTSETVVAKIENEALQIALGSDSIVLDFDYTYWTAMKSVSSDVEVLLRGDIEYRISDSEGYGTLEDVPLLVSFQAEGRGKVVFSSFHWRVQNPSVTNEILLHAAEGLSPGPNADLAGDTP